MILIEEPELFLHPYAIELTRQSLKKLSKGNYQVVIVTHSPILIANEDLPDTLMFRKSLQRGTYRLPTIREKTIEDIKDLPSQTEVLFSLSNKVNILFSEKVLLVEGRTEYRVIPRLYEKINSVSLQSKGIALVPQDGVDNTVKSLKILNNLGLKAYALADMDFVFRGAIKNNLLVESDTNIQSLKTILTSLAGSKGFLLDESGLPKKGNGFSASDAFSLLAQEASAKPYIKEVHSQLKDKGIWIWSLGSIEDHLGVSGKNESVWAAIVNKIESETLETAIYDAETVKQLNTWINE
jgi:predicted ATP-dependent endonuclease of OLD family